MHAYARHVRRHETVIFITYMFHTRAHTHAHIHTHTHTHTHTRTSCPVTHPLISTCQTLAHARTHVHTNAWRQAPTRAHKHTHAQTRTNLTGVAGNGVPYEMLFLVELETFAALIYKDLQSICF